ncbi:MAG: hypothetical protein K2W94_06515 [Alphaproteobacteria bacterium]|nr:hypothetical protein [Alphaproteobacteria bacterium]
MKMRVFFLSLLGLLWIGTAEASVDAMDVMNDISPETIGALNTLRGHPALTGTALLADQIGLLKKVPVYFKTLAAGLVPFKETAGYSSPKATEDRILLKEITEAELPPSLPAATTEYEMYNEEQMISCITQFCFPAAAAQYEHGIRALFKSGKPPKHDAGHLTEGLQCLAGKVLFARALVEKAGFDEEIGNSLQTAAINQILNFHRPTLTESSPDLAFTIPTEMPGCQRCLGLPILGAK